MGEAQRFLEEGIKVTLSYAAAEVAESAEAPPTFEETLDVVSVTVAAYLDEVGSTTAHQPHLPTLKCQIMISAMGIPCWDATCMPCSDAP